MILHVKYDSNNEPITLRTNETTPNGDIKARIKLLQQYKRQGYTHVKDKFWIQLTGRIATINDYIRETRSYL
tara:strand:+ start:1091 stop:1306 length:216 start_codon:yes stop_codon:yes gene_type:complete